MAKEKLNIHIEVRQKVKSCLNNREVLQTAQEFLEKQEEIVLNSPIVDELPSSIECIRVCSDKDGKYKVNLAKEIISQRWHIYQLWEEPPQVDSLDEENYEVPASVNWCLPNSEFEGLWESLVLEDGIKEQLMSYVQTTLLFSNYKVNPKIIHWNSVVLLHGPPGTGKTSLCKALAHKLSIRLNSQYITSQLIEINTHSLFSKWFSESAKLVLKMFTSVKQWLQEKNHFVCIVIDEVESLTHVRQANGLEPSDSIRVVNAVLTQIDQLQRYPNVLILATSNVTETIDLAFADRADLKLLLTFPSEWGVYEILRTCIEELIHCNLIKGSKNAFFEAALFRKLVDSKNGSDGEIMNEVMARSQLLMNASVLCKGLSGRIIRKIPFLTSTKFFYKANPTVEQFLEAMTSVVKKHKVDNDLFYGDKSNLLQDVPIK